MDHLSVVEGEVEAEEAGEGVVSFSTTTASSTEAKDHAAEVEGGEATLGEGEEQVPPEAGVRCSKTICRLWAECSPLRNRVCPPPSHIPFALILERTDI